jgi:hypothetical protein
VGGQVIGRIFLLGRPKILPGKIQAVIYRTSIEGGITATSVIPAIGYKGQSAGESPSEFGPRRVERSQVSLYAAYLGSWQVCENDVLCISGEGITGSLWVRIESFDTKLMGTRFECQCVPILPLSP